MFMLLSGTVSRSMDCLTFALGPSDSRRTFPPRFWWAAASFMPGAALPPADRVGPS